MAIKSQGAPSNWAAVVMGIGQGPEASCRRGASSRNYVGYPTLQANELCYLTAADDAAKRGSSCRIKSHRLRLKSRRCWPE
jgi:hypothetical protein